MNIAVVGTNSKFSKRLQGLLEEQNHKVTPIVEADKAFSKIRKATIHLVVLGSVPVLEDSLKLVRTLRDHAPTRRLAILNIFAGGNPKEVVAMLDAGADDFLAKPFNDEIFLARVRNLLRRQIWSGAIEEEPVTILEAGELNVHLVERAARTGDVEHILTRLEFELLVFLLRRKGEVLKRGDILKAVWKYPEDVETRTLDKHVEKLRRKLGDSGKMIRTVHGVGYRFTEALSV